MPELIDQPHPTAPLPQAALEAIARLEAALTPTTGRNNDNKPVIPKPRPGRRVIAAGYIRRAPHQAATR